MGFPNPPQPTRSCTHGHIKENYNNSRNLVYTTFVESRDLYINDRVFITRSVSAIVYRLLRLIFLVLHFQNVPRTSVPHWDLWSSSTLVRLLPYCLSECSSCFCPLSSLLTQSDSISSRYFCLPCDMGETRRKRHSIRVQIWRVQRVGFHAVQPSSIAWNPSRRHAVLDRVKENHAISQV